MRFRVVQRGLVVVAAVILLAVMLIGAAHLPWVRSRVLDWARARVSSDFGVTVDADELRYNLLGVSVDLHNISLSARGERPFLQADQLRVQIDRRVLIGTVDITAVEVVGPRLTIVRHRDGTTNLPRSQTDASSQPTPIHLGIVSLRQLSAEIQDEAGGHHGAAGPIDLSLDTRRTGAAPGTFGPSAISVVVGAGDTGATRSISGTIGGSLGFDGERISMKNFRVETPEARLTLNGDLDLIAETIRVEAQGRLETDLARVGRFFDLGDSLNGTAAADITVKGPAADPTVHFAGTGNNLRYQAFTASNVETEADYADGRLEIQRLNVTSDLGNATATGSMQVMASASTQGANHLRAHAERLDIDRMLEAADIQLPVRIGSVAAGDVDLALDSRDPFGAGWWQQLSGSGTVQLASKGQGLAVEGRLAIGANGNRWTVEHELRSPAGPTTIAGVVSGEASQGPSGAFASTLLGRSRVRVEALRNVTPIIQRAGFELPASLNDIDGSVDAVVDPRGTIADPRVLATIIGRGIRLPDFPEGQLDATAAFDRGAARVESLAARSGSSLFNASGTYTWSGHIDSRFEATVDDVHEIAKLAAASDLPLSGSAKVTGTLQGTIQAPRGRAGLTARDLSAYEVAIGSVNADVTLANKRVEVDGAAPGLSARLKGAVALDEPYRFQVEGTLDRASISSLLPASVRDQLVAEGTVTATVKSEGNLSQPLASTGEVALRLLEGKLSGIPFVLDAPATLSVEPDAFTATAVGLRVGEQTRVQLEGTLGTTSTRAGVNVRAEGPLSDILAMAAPALADTPIDAQSSTFGLDLHVGGTLLAPQPTGTLAISGASIRYGDQPPLTDVRIDGRIEPARINVPTLAAKWLGAELRGDATVPLRMMVPPSLSSQTAAGGVAAWGSNWFASLPAEPRLAAATVHVTGVTTEALAPFVDAATLGQISANAAATLTAEADAFTLDRVRGSLVVDNASVVMAEVPITQAAPTRIRLGEGRAQIEEFRWKAESNELRVSGGADMFTTERQLDLAIDGDVDLRILGAFASGIASGGTAHSALTVKGPMTNPAILGTLSVRAGEIRLDSPSFAASDVEGTIDIPADRNATVTLNGTVNGGDATVQGNVSLAVLTAPSGRLTVRARNVTLDYPEGFQTESNADLVLTLAPSTSTLGGRIDIVNGLYREPLMISRTLLSGLGSQVAAPESEPSFLSTLGLDVTVTTAEQIRVDNNYGRLNIAGNVQITGTALQPGAVGRIEAEPDGEIYLAGNTYRIESLVIDLTSPRTIAPDVTFLADTHVGDVAIEIALQCSATGVCERDVRSQTSGKTNQEAEAMLFGVSTDTAQAGAQLARLLSGELLGIVGQTFGLDTLRLEQDTNRSDLFDDPTLIAGDVNPASRLTIGKRLGEHVQLAYSQNLAQNGFTMTTSYFAPGGISVRALLLDDQSRSYEFRHQPRLGRPAQKRPAAVSTARIEAIRFSGNLGFSESELRSQLHLTEGDRFAFASWQADRDRLIAFYQNHGFFEARVRARRLLPNGASLESAASTANVESVMLEYATERGRPTRLDISGFDVPNRIRQQIVQRWASAIFDGFLERDATLLVREYLYSVNRLQATVTATTGRNDTDDGKTLHVKIEPGESLTARLVFDGNAAISTVVLVETTQRTGPLAAWLDPPGFALMLARLYHDAGLLSAEINVQPPQIQQGVSTVQVVIREGEPWSIGQVAVDGAGPRGNVNAIEAFGLPENSRYSPKSVAERVAGFEQRFRDLGFLNAHVTAETSLDAPARRVNLHVIAEPGPRTFLASVTIEGPDDTRAAVERKLKLETGAPLSATELSAARRLLYETGSYRSVDIDLEPATETRVADSENRLPTDRAVVARVRVQERPRYTLRYGLAVNDDFVAPGQRSQQLGFAADVENQNILGRGATLGASARLRRDQEVGRIYMGIPRFFSLPIQSTLFFSRGRQDLGSDSEFKTTSDITEISAQQTYRVRRLATVTYGYGLGRNRTTIQGSDFDVTVRVARLNGNAIVERRNDPFDPSRGWFTSSNLELSRPGLGSELSFLRSYFQQLQFVPIRHGIVIASAARVGLARTYRDETLIPSERFFAGGGTSVRGYRDDSLGPRSAFGDAAGGSALFIANGEARFPVYRWLRGVGFLDLGNVYPTVTDMLHSGVQAGAGGGIRVNSPVGLLRLDFGVPINRRPFDPKWTVTFGLGHAF